jgi:hypothetical protein
MKSSIVNAARGAVLAATTFFPQAGRGQETTPQTPAVAPAIASGPSPVNTDPTLALKVPDAKKHAEVPAGIVELATAKGIDPADIKLEGVMWVACEGEQCTPIAKALPSEIPAREEKLVLRKLRQGDSLIITGHPIQSHRVEAPDYGIPNLGTFKRQPDGTISFEAYENFKGTVEYNTKEPRTVSPVAATEVSVHRPYSAEYLREIQKVLADPAMKVVMVVSVPNQCEPCRLFKNDVATAADGYGKSDKVKIFTIDFASFEEARAVMGPLKSFPATIVFPARDAQAAGAGSLEAGGALTLPFIPNAGRPYQQHFGRMESGPLRKFINEAAGALGDTIKGVGGMLMGR